MKSLKINNQQVTLVDQVEDKLLMFFRLHDLHPGDPIPKEQELAEALGVARSVLREALSRLRMLGYIETRTRRGMVLTEPSLLGGLKRVVDPRILSDEILFNILGFRVALEIGICHLIFQNLTDNHITEIEQIVNRGIVLENNEYSPVSEFEFHTKLYEITENKTIVEFHEIIRPVSIFVKEKFKDLIEPINRELIRKGEVVTHKDLLSFLKKRDKTSFQNAMENHFAPYNQFLKKKSNATSINMN
jgi:GntR family transcriptional regulator, transcriptional repressor for pyruvate dehydrogenase complex